MAEHGTVGHTTAPNSTARAQPGSSAIATSHFPLFWLTLFQKNRNLQPSSHPLAPRPQHVGRGGSGAGEALHRGDGRGCSWTAQKLHCSLSAGAGKAPVANAAAAPTWHALTSSSTPKANCCGSQSHRASATQIQIGEKGEGRGKERKRYQDAKH